MHPATGVSLSQLVTTILHSRAGSRIIAAPAINCINYSPLQEHCFEEHNWQQLAEQFHLTTRTAFRHIKRGHGLNAG